MATYMTYCTMTMVTLQTRLMRLLKNKPNIFTCSSDEEIALFASDVISR